MANDDKDSRWATENLHDDPEQLTPQLPADGAW